MLAQDPRDTALCPSSCSFTWVIPVLVVLHKALGKLSFQNSSKETVWRSPRSILRSGDFLERLPGQRKAIILMLRVCHSENIGNNQGGEEAAGAEARRSQHRLPVAFLCRLYRQSLALPGTKRCVATPAS